MKFYKLCNDYIVTKVRQMCFWIVFQSTTFCKLKTFTVIEFVLIFLPTKPQFLKIYITDSLKVVEQFVFRKIPNFFAQLEKGIKRCSIFAFLMKILLFLEVNFWSRKFSWLKKDKTRKGAFFCKFETLSPVRKILQIW